MRSALLLFAIWVGLGALAAACIGIDATGGPSGGDSRLDATVVTAPCGTGTAWSDLYRDYFGPTGNSSCTKGNADCHLDPTQSGAKASNYVCGHSSDECYAGMVGHIVPAGGVPPGGKKKPTDTDLLVALRKTDDVLSTGTPLLAQNGVDPSMITQGTMPRDSQFAWGACDIDRIVAWMNAGARNDSPTFDAGVDSGFDAGADAGRDAAGDAARDATPDAPAEAGGDAAADAPLD